MTDETKKLTETHLLEKECGSIIWFACGKGALGKGSPLVFDINFTKDVDDVTCKACKRTRFYKDKVAQGLFKDGTEIKKTNIKKKS